MKVKLLRFSLVSLFFTCSLFAQSYDFGKTKVFSGFDPAVAFSEETKAYLDALITYLYANPAFKIKITGHSDNTGTFEQNEKLSSERAKMFSDYILSKGIEKSRILENGEGARMPIAPNDSPEKMAMNNRVEVSVVHTSAESSESECKCEHHSNHFGIFGGATTFIEAKVSYFTAGLEYEYRLPILHKKLGIGVFVEAVFAHEIEYVAGVPIFVHPYRGLKILVAPGVSIVGDTKEFLMRGGIGYDIYFGSFAITPNFNVDYVNEHFSMVYGITLGFGF